MLCCKLELPQKVIHMAACEDLGHSRVVILCRAWQMLTIVVEDLDKFREDGSLVEETLD